MKKFLSLIIAFILSVGAFSICAYADGPQLPDFSETGGEFYITDPDNGTLHLYIKNGKILLEGYAIPLFDEIKIKTNALIDGEYGYIYLTFFPLFHIKAPVGEMEYIDPNDFKQAYVKSYNEKIGNTTYYVDEYVIDNILTKNYFLNNEFKFCKSINDGYETTLTLESTDVDDKKFELPFYSIDITFIFNWIFGNRIIY